MYRRDASCCSCSYHHIKPILFGACSVLFCQFWQLLYNSANSANSVWCMRCFLPTLITHLKPILPIFGEPTRFLLKFESICFFDTQLLKSEDEYLALQTFSSCVRYEAYDV